MQGRGSIFEQRKQSRRASVLVVVLVTLVFATTALLLFIERASTDLIVHVRDADRLRLRQEAYSALETTLAVLVDFQEVLGGLHSPAEGWSDPLEWADYEPQEGHEVTIEFVDESGKLSFSKVDFQTWFDLFVSWGAQESDAELWADSLLGWTQEDYVPVSFDAPEAKDYERDVIGFIPPQRPLRSMSELKAIENIREVFFDETGRPTSFYNRFVDSVSLFEYDAPNLNSAPESVLAALGKYDENQQSLLSDYRNSEGIYRGRSSGYFTSADEVSSILGEGGVAPGFGAEIQALRINITVRQVSASYRLSVVVAPPNGAKLVAAPAIPRKKSSSQEETEETVEPERASSVAEQIANEDNDGDEPIDLEYPFTLLEIREIDAPDRMTPSELVKEFY
jgi:hypothetical protein